MSGPARVARSLVRAAAGVSIALLVLFYALAFAGVVFAGPLRPEIAAAMHGAFWSGAAFVAVSLLAALRSGIVWQQQAVAVLPIALGAADLAERLDGAPAATLVATVLAFVAVSTAAVGVAMLLVGLFRLGAVGRFAPFPVVSGFMAATGLLLMLNGVRGAAGVEAVQAALLDPDALARWVPPAAAGVLLAILVRRARRPAILPAGVLGYAAAEYALALIRGGRPAGLFDPAALAGLGSGWRPGPLALPPGWAGAVDTAALSAQAPLVLAVVCLVVIGTLVHITALEHADDRTIDIDRELMVGGVTNLAAALGAGLPGFQSPAMTSMARMLSGGPGPAVAVGMAAALAAVWAAGPDVLVAVPEGALRVVVIYLGADLVLRWLVQPWTVFASGDRAIVGAIIAVALGLDFVLAVALGVAAVSLQFALAYARLGVLRARTNGRLRRSSTERAPAEAERLAALGAATLVFELQGYLFFGTAHGALGRIAGDVAEAARGGTPPDCVILDFRRVSGFDVSSAVEIARLARRLGAAGIETVAAGLSDPLDRQLGRAQGSVAIARAATLDGALALREERLLVAGGGGQAGGAADFGPEIAEVVALAGPTGSAPPGREAVPRGGVVVRQGDPSDSLLLLEEGRLVATVTVPGGGTAEVARFLPGAVVGEIGFSAGTPRSATLVAETDCVVRRLDRATLDRVAETHPMAALRLHRAIAALLARRLARTTALLVALDRS